MNVEMSRREGASPADQEMEMDLEDSPEIGGDKMEV